MGAKVLVVRMGFFTGFKCLTVDFHVPVFSSSAVAMDPSMLASVTLSDVSAISNID